MHSKKIKLLSIFLLISFLFTLTSCLLNLDRGKKIYKAIFVYLDDPVVEDDNLKIDFTASSYSYSLNNHINCEK